MASRLTPEVIKVIKDTAPVVAPLAETITQTFYPKMFKNNPEVFRFFNKRNQAEGRQPRALANAVVGYASNIENLGVLGHAVELMVEKHCALGVQPEDYAIVHANLMEAIGEVLGDAVTPEIGNAWSESVLALADILIAAEKARYDEVAEAPGGWRGKRRFRVARIVKESVNARSVYLEPVDGGALPLFAKPGQYVSVADNPIADEEEFVAPRHYTMSGIDEQALRITVRHHESVDGAPAGMMSTHIHALNEGDEINLHAPFGAHHFDVKESGDSRPAVFVSAGIGCTPSAAMLPAAIRAGRPVAVAHVCQTPDHFALRSELVDQVLNADGRVRVVYSRLDNGQGLADFERAGRFTAKDVLDVAPSTDSEFFLCGPPQFMRDVYGGLVDAGVEASSIRYEAFGPQVRMN